MLGPGQIPPRLRTAYEAGHVEHRPPEPLPDWANYERHLLGVKTVTYREQTDYALLKEGAVLRQHCSSSSPLLHKRSQGPFRSSGCP